MRVDHRALAFAGVALVVLSAASSRGGESARPAQPDKASAIGAQAVPANAAGGTASKAGLFVERPERLDLSELAAKPRNVERPTGRQSRGKAQLDRPERPDNSDRPGRPDMECSGGG